jgi:hypothetical protein
MLSRRPPCPETGRQRRKCSYFVTQSQPVHSSRSSFALMSALILAAKFIKRVDDFPAIQTNSVIL